MDKTTQVLNNGMKLNRDLSISSIRSLEDEKERRFELSFSSEEPYARWWDTVEILDHKDSAMDLKRLNEIGVVLYNHDKNKVVGRIIKAWNEDNRGKAVIEFDTDSDSSLIYDKVKSGTLKGVSVGYVVNSWEEVSAGKKSSDERFVGPCYIARSWTPFEISIVSVPADSSVGVGRSIDNKNGICPLSLCEKQIQINNKIMEVINEY